LNFCGGHTSRGTFAPCPGHTGSFPGVQSQYRHRYKSGNPSPSGVAPAGARTPRVVGEAQLRPDRDELAPAGAVRFVAKQFGAPEPGDDEVREPVAVEVRDRGAVRVPPVEFQPGARGDVFELQPAEVAVQAARVPARFALRPEEPAARDEHVEPAVGIEVEQRDAGAERFENGEPVGLFAGATGGANAGALRHVAEPRGTVARRGRHRRHRRGRRGARTRQRDEGQENECAHGGCPREG
jgi:hypothetical protein